ncbi:hypothetical protein LAZ67_4004022 [Cordylochernes scorpioides]|uniref:CCHC-type domain-containing protein n=1 Tax=Cordylochernes scorpioides TaxID=51811 RepID=A0ABY6KHM3_9ARAC|nr:hypothetical protein LAZ67_4004022 [Cordylochernes scorpioides]
MTKVREGADGSSGSAGEEPGRPNIPPPTGVKNSKKNGIQKRISKEISENRDHVNPPAGVRDVNLAAARDDVTLSLPAGSSSNGAARILGNWADCIEDSGPGADNDFTVVKTRKRRRESSNSPTAAAPSSNIGGARSSRRTQSSARSVPRAQEIPTTRAHIAEARARQASSAEEHCVYLEHGPELQPFHYLRALDRLLGGTAGVIQVSKVNGHQLLGLANRGLAERLINNGLEVEGTLLRAFPFRKRAERITVGNLPFFVEDSAIIKALGPYGRITSIAPKMMKAGPYTYTDGRREAFIVLHEGVTTERLPTRLNITIKGEAWPAYLSSGIKCSRCHGQGHRRANCPLLAGRTTAPGPATPTSPTSVPPATAPRLPQQPSAQPPPPASPSPTMEVSDVPPTSRAALHPPAALRQPQPAPSALPAEDAPPAPPPVTPAPSLRTPGSREPAAPTPDVEETSASFTSTAKNATRIDLDAFIERHPSVSFAETDALGLGREEVLDLLSSRTKTQRSVPLLPPSQCNALARLIRQILDLRPGAASNLYKVLGQVKAELRTTPAAVPPTPPLPAPRPAEPMLPTTHREKLTPPLMTPPPPAPTDMEEDDPMTEKERDTPPPPAPRLAETTPPFPHGEKTSPHNATPPPPLSCQFIDDRWTEADDILQELNKERDWGLGISESDITEAIIYPEDREPLIRRLSTRRRSLLAGFISAAIERARDADPFVRSSGSAGQEPGRPSIPPPTGVKNSKKNGIQKRISKEISENRDHVNPPAGVRDVNLAAARDDVTLSLPAGSSSNGAARVLGNWADCIEDSGPGADSDFTVVKTRKRRRESSNSPTAAAPSSNIGGARSSRRTQSSARSVPRAQEIPTTRAHIAEARARQASSAEEHCVYLEHGPELQPFHYLRALDRLLGGTAGVIQVSKVNGHQLLGLANRGLAERLINNGLEVEGTLLRAFPFRKRAERITVGNLPFFVEDSAIIKALGPYGRITSIAPKMMKAGPYTYTDGRREAFIVLHEGVTTERLPTRLNITIKGEAWPAYLSSGIKCSRCHGQGHRRANCPLLAGRTTAPGPATPTSPTSVPPATAPRLPQQPSAQPPPPASPSPTMEVSDVPPTSRAALHPPAALRQPQPAPSALPAEDAPPAPPPVTPAPSLRTPGSREPAAPTPDVEMSIVEETFASSTSSAKNATRVDLDAFIEKHPSVSFAGTDALGLGREEVLDLLSSRTKTQRKGPLLSPPQCDALAGLIRQILNLKPGAASNLYKVLGQVKAELRTTPAAVPPTPPLPAPRPAEPMLPTTHREELTPPLITPPPPAPTDMEEDDPITEEERCAPPPPAPRLAGPIPPVPHGDTTTPAMTTPPPPLSLDRRWKMTGDLIHELSREIDLEHTFQSQVDMDDIVRAVLYPGDREPFIKRLPTRDSPSKAEQKPARHGSLAHTCAELSANQDLQNEIPIVLRKKQNYVNPPAGSQDANSAAPVDLAAVPTSNAAAQVRRNWADITEEVNPGAEEGFTLVQGRKRRRGSANSPTAAAPSSNAGGSRTIRRPQPSARSVPRAQEIPTTRTHITEARARQASSSEEHCVYLEHGPELQPFHYLRALDRLLGGTAGIIQISKVNGHQLLGLANRGLAERLINNGLEVEGTLLRAFPFRKRAERITVSNLPFFVEDSAIINALRPFGRITSIAPKMMKAGPYTYTDGRREAFIVLHEGMTTERLPTRLNITIKGEAWPAYLSTGIKCSRCHGQGHRRANCPLLAGLANNTRTAPPTTPAGVPPPTTPAPPQRSAAQLPAPTPSNPAMEVCSAPPVARAALHSSAPRPSPPAAPAFPMEETPSAPPPVTPAPSLQTPGSREPAAPTPDVEMSIVEETLASFTSSAKNATRVDLDAFIEGHPSVSFAKTDALGLGREEVLDLLSSRTKAQRKGPLLSPPQCDALAGLIGQILDLRPGAASNLYKVLGQVKAELRSTPAVPPTPPLHMPRPSGPTPPTSHSEELMPAVMTPPPPALEDDPDMTQWQMSLSLFQIFMKEPDLGPTPSKAEQKPARHGSLAHPCAELSANQDLQNEIPIVLRKKQNYVNPPAGSQDANSAAPVDLAAVPTSNAAAQVRRNWADITEEVNPGAEEGFTLVQGRKRRRGSANSPTAAAPSSNAGGSRTIRRPQPSARSVPRAQEIPTTRTHITEARARQASSSEEHCVYLEHGPELQPFHYLRALDRLLGGTAGIIQISKVNGHQLLGLANRGLAERLINNGLEVEGTLLRAFPFRKRAERITVSNLPFFVEDSAIINALRPFGRITSIAPKMMKAGPYTYTDGRREAFIVLHEGMTTERLPTRLNITIKGEAWPAYLSTGIKCSRCHGQGHRRANCPLLAGLANNTRTAPPTTPAGVPPPTTPAPPQRSAAQLPAPTPSNPAMEVCSAPPVARAALHSSATRPSPPAAPAFPMEEMPPAPPPVTPAPSLRTPGSREPAAQTPDVEMPIVDETFASSTSSAKNATRVDLDAFIEGHPSVSFAKTDALGLGREEVLDLLSSRTKAQRKGPLLSPPQCDALVGWIGQILDLRPGAASNLYKVLGQVKAELRTTPAEPPTPPLPAPRPSGPTPPTPHSEELMPAVMTPLPPALEDDPDMTQWQMSLSLFQIFMKEPDLGPTPSKAEQKPVRHGEKAQPCAELSKKEDFQKKTSNLFNKNQNYANLPAGGHHANPATPTDFVTASFSEAAAQANRSWADLAEDNNHESEEPFITVQRKKRRRGSAESPAAAAPSSNIRGAGAIRRPRSSTGWAPRAEEIRTTRAHIAEARARQASSTEDHCVYVERSPELEPFHYMRAIERMFGGTREVFQLTKMNGHFLVGLANRGMAERLINEGLEVEGTLHRAFPFRKRAERITVGNLPFFVGDAAVISALSSFGRVTSIAPKLMKAGPYIYNDGRREAFIIFREGMTIERLPTRLEITIKGEAWPAYLSSGIRCSRCRGQGHRRANCPLLAGLANNTRLAPPTTPAAVPSTTTSATPQRSAAQPPTPASSSPARETPGTSPAARAVTTSTAPRPSPPVAPAVPMEEAPSTPPPVTPAPSLQAPGGPAQRTLGSAAPTPDVEMSIVEETFASSTSSAKNATRVDLDAFIEGHPSVSFAETDALGLGREEVLDLLSSRTKAQRKGPLLSPPQCDALVGVIGQILNLRPGAASNLYKVLGQVKAELRTTPAEPPTPPLPAPRPSGPTPPTPHSEELMPAVMTPPPPALEANPDLDQWEMSLSLYQIFMKEPDLGPTNWADITEEVNPGAEEGFTLVQGRKRRRGSANSPTAAAPSSNPGGSRTIRRPQPSAGSVPRAQEIRVTRAHIAEARAWQASSSEEHCVYIEHSSELEPFHYLRALDRMLGGTAGVIQITKVNGHQLLGLTNRSLAERLISEGLEVEGTLLRAFPFRKRAERITVGNLPFFVADSAVITALSPYGRVTSIAPKQMKAGPYVYVDGRRDVFITLHEGITIERLPTRLDINIKGEAWPAYLSSGIRCSRCHGQGHRRAICPLLAGLANNTRMAPPTTPAGVPPPTTPAPPQRSAAQPPAPTPSNPAMEVCSAPPVARAALHSSAPRPSPPAAPAYPMEETPPAPPPVTPASSLRTPGSREPAAPTPDVEMSIVEETFASSTSSAKNATRVDLDAFIEKHPSVSFAGTDALGLGREEVLDLLSSRTRTQRKGPLLSPPQCDALAGLIRQILNLKPGAASNLYKVLGQVKAELRTTPAAVPPTPPLPAPRPAEPMLPTTHREELTPPLMTPPPPAPTDMEEDDPITEEERCAPPPPAPRLAGPIPPVPHGDTTTPAITTPPPPLSLDRRWKMTGDLIHELSREIDLEHTFQTQVDMDDIVRAVLYPGDREPFIKRLPTRDSPSKAEEKPARPGSLAQPCAELSANQDLQNEIPIVLRKNQNYVNPPAGSQDANSAAPVDLAAISTSNAAAQIRRNWADITEEVNPGAEEGFTLVQGRKRRRGSGNSPTTAAPSSNAGASRTIRRPQSSAGSVPRAQEIRATRAHIADARARQASSSEEHCVYIEHSPELEPFHYLRALDRKLGGTAGVIQITKVNGHQLLGLTNRGLAERLISEGLEVEGTLLRAFPFRKRAERITVSNLPFFVADSAVITALSPYGRVTSIAPKQMKAGPYVYVDGRRDVFITLHEGITIERLPTRLDINIKGEAWPAYLSSGIRCSRCHGQGHRRAICPLLAGLANNTRMAPPTTPAGVPPPTTPAPPQRSAAQPPAPTPSNPLEVCGAPPVARAALHSSAPRPSPPAAPAFPMEETPSAPPPVTPAPSLQTPGSREPAAPTPDVEMSIVEETLASFTSSAKNATRVDLDAFIEGHPSVSFAKTDALGLGREEVLDLLSSRTKAQRKGPLLSPPQCDALAGLIGQILDLRPGAASNLYKVLGQVKAELRSTPAVPPTPPLPAPRPSGPTPPTSHSEELMPAVMTPPPPALEDDPDMTQWQMSLSLFQIFMKEPDLGPTPSKAEQKPVRHGEKAQPCAELSKKEDFQKKTSNLLNKNQNYANPPAGGHHANPATPTDFVTASFSEAAAQANRSWADLAEDNNHESEEPFITVQRKKRRRGSAESPAAAAPSSNIRGAGAIRRPRSSTGWAPRAEEIRTTRAHIAEARARQASSTEDHCVYVERSPELEPFHYMRAIERMFGGTREVFQLTKMNGHFLVGLANRGMAERLINEGLEVEGTLHRAFPFRKRAERITVGNLPFFVGDAAVISALSSFGRVTSIAPKLMKAGPYIYNDGRREAFIIFREGMTIERLPTRLDITIKGEAWPAYLSSGIRCSRCRGQGHRRANCPLLAGLANNTRLAPPTTPAAVPSTTTSAPPQRSAAQPPTPASSSPARKTPGTSPAARAVTTSTAPRPSPPVAPAVPMEEAPSTPPPVTPAPSLQAPGVPAQRILGSAAPTPDVEMSIVEETFASSTSSAKNATRVDLDAFIEGHPSVSFAETDALGLGREEVLDLLSSRTKAQRKGPLLSPPQCDALVGVIGQILNLRPGAASNLYKVLGQVKAELRTTPAEPPTPPLPAPRPSGPTPPTPHSEELMPAVMTPPPPALEDNPDLDQWEMSLSLYQIFMKEPDLGPTSKSGIDQSELTDATLNPRDREELIEQLLPRQRNILAQILDALLERALDLDPFLRGKLSELRASLPP